MFKLIPGFSRYKIHKETKEVYDTKWQLPVTAFPVKNVLNVCLHSDRQTRLTRTITGLHKLAFPELYEEKISCNNLVIHEAGDLSKCSDDSSTWTKLQILVRQTFTYNLTTGELALKNHLKAGWLDKSGYRHVKLFGVTLPEHRVIFIYMLGSISKDMQVDHVNHIKDDNRWGNLRLVNNITNSKNLPIYSNNTSGSMGISWHKRQQKWVARIMVNGKAIQIGSFSDKEEAILARKLAIEKYKFHENHGK